jgi:hypothetical protein
MKVGLRASGLSGPTAKSMHYAALPAICLVTGSCKREEARLKNDISLGYIRILHPRFPCRSPALHLFGYRFQIYLQGEVGEGNVCWSFSSRQWTWQILPEYGLSRLNTR